MKRARLAAPTPVLADAPSFGWGATPLPAGDVAPERSSVTHGQLEPAVVAREQRRPWFHPRSGWLRRLERSTARWISRNVYPYVPGLHLPYDALLRRQLTLSEAAIPIENLHEELEGLRVLLLTDLHVGPFVSPRRMREILARLIEERPDVVLLGGDVISGRLDEIEIHREALRELRAPLGVFAVLGNHDHYTRSPERVIAALEALEIEVLHNRSVRLRRGRGSLTLAGVDDLLLGRPDLDAALAGAESPLVLLSHNPDLFFEAVRGGVALMLSGHTHGGQIRLPGLPVLVRQSRYRLDAGRYTAGPTELVVSRGVGAVGLPWRMACPPEAVLIRLIRKSPA